MKKPKWLRIIDSWPLGDSYGEWRRDADGHHRRFWPLVLNRAEKIGQAVARNNQPNDRPKQST